MDVICFSGSEYAETPRALVFEGQRLDVAQVLATWRTPHGKGFRVQATDGSLFELFYSALADCWQITPLQLA